MNSKDFGQINRAGHWRRSTGNKHALWSVSSGYILAIHNESGRMRRSIRQKEPTSNYHDTCH